MTGNDSDNQDGGADGGETSPNRPGKKIKGTASASKMTKASVEHAHKQTDQPLKGIRHGDDRGSAPVRSPSSTSRKNACVSLNENAMKQISPAIFRGRFKEKWGREAIARDLGLEAQEVIDGWSGWIDWATAIVVEHEENERNILRTAAKARWSLRETWRRRYQGAAECPGAATGTNFGI